MTKQIKIHSSTSERLDQIRYSNRSRKMSYDTVIRILLDHSVKYKKLKDQYDNIRDLVN